jgi:hypothetical protein
MKKKNRDHPWRTQPAPPAASSYFVNGKPVSKEAWEAWTKAIDEKQQQKKKDPT